MAYHRVSLTTDILKGVEARYPNDNDASMRLSASIIRYKGTPIWVQNVSDNGYILCWNCKTPDNVFEVHYNDKNLDVSSPPIGWINVGASPIYLSRHALHSQKQGLSLKTVSAYFTNSGEWHRGINSAQTIIDGIADTISGTFPDLHSVVNSGAGAWSREWAIGPNKKGVSVLYHKSIPVGTYFSASRTFLFAKGRLSKTRRTSMYDNIQGRNYYVEEQS